MESSNIKNLDGIKKIHFIGIGGSGMFPLAKILYSQGFEVTGSDIYESDTMEKIEKLGIKVTLNQKKENIQNHDLVVFSAAIKESNPEIVAAKEKSIPIIERSVLLGIIFKNYKNSVAVSGTHGKTTTTSMITSVLLDAGKEPTAVIGASLKKINGNSCTGNSDIIVGEACEYVDSFLQLFPSISVITNVDADHLDYFGSLENVKKSFGKFASQTKKLIIVNGDDDNSRDCVKDVKVKKIFFGTGEDNTYSARNVTYTKMQQAKFDIFKGSEKISHIELTVPGKHNLYNALAAFIVCSELKVPGEVISKSLHEFSGAHRRFEILGKINDITVVDDFAHHPTEIKATLNAASKMGFNRVWAVFQPHTYSRTYMLLGDFAEALSIADKVVVSEILPVREVNTYGIHSRDLTDKIENSVYIPDFEQITEHILKNARPGDLVLTLGGGNVYRCANMIKSGLEKLNS